MSKKSPKTATEVVMEGREAEERERIAMLAEQIKLLFGFAAQMIPDIDLLERVAKLSDDRVSTADAMAPILMAHGMNWEKISMEKRVHAKRAEAVLALIRTLKETEDERIEFQRKHDAGQKGRDELSKILGI